MREAAFEIARQSNAFAPSIADQLVHWFAAPLSKLNDLWTLHRLRRTLAALSDYQLADIGLNRADIADQVDRAETPAAVIARLRGVSRTCAWACTAR